MQRSGDIPYPDVLRFPVIRKSPCSGTTGTVAFFFLGLELDGPDELPSAIVGKEELGGSHRVARKWGGGVGSIGGNRANITTQRRCPIINACVDHSANSAIPLKNSL